MDAKVGFRQQLVFVVPFQGGRCVLDEAIWLKRIRDELGVEWDVRQGVAVLDSANQLRSVNVVREDCLNVSNYRR